MDANLKEVLTLYAPIIATGLSALVLYLQSRQKKVIESVAGDVLRVEKATNSMKDQLVAATRTAAHSEGVEQERVDQALRAGERAKGAAAAAGEQHQAGPGEMIAQVVVPKDAAAKGGGEIVAKVIVPPVPPTSHTP